MRYMILYDEYISYIQKFSKNVREQRKVSFFWPTIQTVQKFYHIFVISYEMLNLLKNLPNYTKVTPLLHHSGFVKWLIIFDLT